MRADPADAYALLTDGRCVHVRAVTCGDWQAVHDFVATLGPESLRRRFSTVPWHPGVLLADVLCAAAVERSPAPHGALMAQLEGRVVGLAEWHRTRDAHEAEIAFEVSDVIQGRGVATLLAEHLMLAAERAGIRRLTALAQREDQEMLAVFLSLGMPVEQEWDGTGCALAIPLEPVAGASPAVLDAVARREAVAGEASLRPLLRPAVLAVLGAPGDAAAEAILRNLDGFSGTVYRGGARGELLQDHMRPDLAVVTSPPPDAVAAARRLAELGARSLVVTSGFTGGHQHAAGLELLRICHEAGMRLVGPGSLGLAAPHEPAGFTAVLCASPVRPGPAGVAVQSGGVGLALLAHLERLAVGVSSFAAVGEKYDVSANDLLMHWAQDPDTRFGLLHVESFGNPRKFARTARALARRIPLFAVEPERSPGRASTALYEQAGIITVHSLGALVCTAALAAHQPAPGGPGVAVITNTHGMLSLVVQACVNEGLKVTDMIDLGPAADTAALADAVTRASRPRAKDAAAAHAVFLALAPTVPQAPDPLAAAEASAGHVPVLAFLPAQPEGVAVLRRHGAPPGVSLPAYSDAAAAARALHAVVRAGAVSREIPESPQIPPHTDLAGARTLIGQWLADAPSGRELSGAEAARLLALVGISGAGQHQRSGQPAVSLTGAQDPVFGPVLSASARHMSEAITRLVPVGARQARLLAGNLLDRPDADLADLVQRLSALLDACPELVSIRVGADFTDAGTLTGGARAGGAVAPATHDNPYLRRLRRAPVE